MSRASFNPDMLRLVRDLRGVTQGELATRCGCTQSFVSQAEHGDREVNPERAAAFASVLGFPVEFFYQEGRYSGLGISLVFYRKKQSALAAHLTRLQAEVALRRLVASRLLRGVSIGKTTRSFQFMDIDEFDGRADKVAALLRASWQLGTGPIPNLIAVIENAGGVVFKFPFGTKDIDAMSQWPDDGPPLFFVNSEAPSDRLRFSLSHELGHVVMHRAGTPEMEGEADQFAAAFLMPAMDIASDLTDLDLPKAARLKPYWRVSMGALIKRARDLERVSPERYTMMWREMSRRGYRKSEPVTIPPEQPAFWSELVGVYQRNMGFDLSGLAKINHLTREEFEPRFDPRSGGLRLAV